MKKRHNFLKSTGGFSLVEVMVAAGMLGVVSLGVMQVTQNANKTAKGVSQQVEIQDMLNKVNRAMTSQSACRWTLGTAGPNPNVNVTSIGADFNGGFDVNDVYGNQRLSGTYPLIIDSGVTYGEGANSITADAVRVFGYVETGGPLNGQRFGTVSVGVRFKKGRATTSEAKHKKSSFGTQLVTKVFDSINVVVDDASNNVTDCYADQNQFLEASCQMLSGTFNTGNGLCESISINNESAGTGVFSIIANTADTSTAGDLTDDGGIKAEGGLVVGDPYTNDTTSPGVGNAVIGNALTVIDAGLALTTELSDIETNGGSGIMQGSFRVGYLPAAPAKPVLAPGDFHATGQGVFRRSLGIGPGAVAGTGVTPPANNGDVKLTGALRIGSTADPVAGEALRADGGRIEFENDTNTSAAVVKSRVSFNRANAIDASASDIDFNLNAATMMRSQENGITKFIVGTNGAITVQNTDVDPRFTVDSNGTISVKRGVATKMVLGGILPSGSASDAYRPSYIYNMPAYGSGTLDATARREIPTKKWVLDAIYNSLSDSLDLGTLMQTVSSAITDNPFQAVLATICANIRVNNTVGGTTTGSMAGGNCTVNTTVCGMDGGAGRCSTHYSQNYQATGSATVYGTSNLRGSVTLNQDGGSLRVYGTSRFDRYINTYGAGSYIFARNAAVYAGTFVYGTTYVRGRGTAKTGLSGICGETGCATRFGRYKCSAGGVVLGIANGRLICGRVGGGGSSPQAF